MKKQLLLLPLFIGLSISITAFAEEPTLEDQLKTMEVPANKAPPLHIDESVYAIQSRYAPLKFKNEFSFGGASNLSSDSFLNTKHVDVGYRFHFSDRWSLGLEYSEIENQFNSTANRVIENQGIYPDVAFARTYKSLTADFNAFYGKFRFSMNRVFYFDQYFQLGPVQVEQSSETANGYLGGAGIVLWIEKWGALRFSLRDYYYNEIRKKSSDWAHNIDATGSFSILL